MKSIKVLVDDYLIIPRPDSRLRPQGEEWDEYRFLRICNPRVFRLLSELGVTLNFTKWERTIEVEENGTRKWVLNSLPQEEILVATTKNMSNERRKELLRLCKKEGHIAFVNDLPLAGCKCGKQVRPKNEASLLEDIRKLVSTD